MTDDQHGVENEETQLKRKAVRELMFDRSLSSEERTKQIQLIMSGKVKPWEELSATKSPPEIITSSVNNSGGSDNTEGAEVPAAAAVASTAAPSNKTVDEQHGVENEKRQLKQKAIRDVMFDRSLSSTERTKQIQLIMSGKVKPWEEPTAATNYNDDRPSSHAAGVNAMNSVAAVDSTIDAFEGGEDETVELGIIGGDDETMELGLIGGGEDSTVELGTIGDEDETVELGTIGDGEDGTVELGTIGEEDEGTVELGTIGGDDSTLGTMDDTVELGTLGDVSDLSSLESKSSLTSRNWSNRFRAAALEAKIAAKIRKAGDSNAQLKEDGEAPDGEYTVKSGSGDGSLQMLEEHTLDEEVPTSNSAFAISLQEDIDGRNEPLFPNPNMTEGDETNDPNSSNPDGIAVATAVAPDDEPDYVYQAIEYDPDAKPPLHKNRRFRVYTYFALFLIFTVVVLVVVYTTSLSKEAEIKFTTIDLGSQPTLKPTLQPTTFREAQGIIEQLQVGVLLRNEIFEDMQLTDPRRLALDWILHKDEQRLVTDSINLYQRYGLAVLAYAMDSKAWYFCGNPGENFTETLCSVYDSAMNKTVDHGIWLSGVSECDWYGVTCSSDGIVRSVELISNNLVGVLPHELTAVRFLQMLALAGNCIYGTIPEEIGQLDHLLALELHENGLSGVMPSTIYQLKKLQLLNLAKQYGVDRKCKQSNGTTIYTNYKHGGFINEFNVGLTGTLGPDLGKWKSMKGLYLSQNSFTGEITEDIGNLRYLTFLRVNDNFIEGSLPPTITNLRNLRHLLFDDNFFYTSLPDGIGNMKDLERLSVNGNSMFGKLPDGMYELKKLKSLFLHDTSEANSPWLINNLEGFSGSLSSSVGRLKDLEYLLLNNNPITGDIPADLGNCTKLKVLRLHRTDLKGSMPREVCMLRDKDLNSDQGVGVLYADCRPNNKTEEPRVQCDCCTDCCDYSTGICVQDD